MDISFYEQTFRLKWTRVIKISKTSTVAPFDKLETYVNAKIMFRLDPSCS